MTVFGLSHTIPRVNIGSCSTLLGIQNIEPRLAQDITGGYQRYDLFHLRVDRTPYTYAGVEFATRSHHDPLAVGEELKATTEAEILDSLPGAE